MSNTKLLNAWDGALKANDKLAFDQLTSNDFKFTGPVPEPMNGDAYYGIMRILMNACSNLNNNLKVSGETDDSVSGSVQMTGTHDGDLDLTRMGMGVIPATHKSFKLPVETFSAGVKNGKIASFQVSVPEGGGLMGILKQLGVPPPG